MGLLKKIIGGVKKVVKKVFKGVKKVFKKATKFVGRALKSKWGKAIMLGAAIFFTAGGAGMLGGGGLFGGGAGIAAGEGVSASGFFSKFVTGASNIAQAFTGGAGGSGGGEDGEGGGFLMQAARTAGNFLQSPLVGNVITGYAQGKMQEEQLKEEERIRNQPHEWWRDPERLGKLEEATSQDIATPQGLMDRARRVDEYLDERRNRYQIQPGDPSDVYGSYVTG